MCGGRLCAVRGKKQLMTLLTRRGEGPSFLYAGQPMHILAGHEGQPAGFAAMEITVPPHFAGPLPHAHDEFDEGIYVLAGRLQVTGEVEAQEAVAGSIFVAAPGSRHGFSNPYAESALGLGIWASTIRGWEGSGAPPMNRDGWVMGEP